ncbi:MAG TPA: hypothetical protein VF633_11520 [Brevundimonas sp.]
MLRQWWWITLAIILASVVAVFGGVSSPEVLLLCPAIMLIPGAVAGSMVRKVAYA